MAIGFVLQKTLSVSCWSYPNLFFIGPITVASFGQNEQGPHPVIIYSAIRCECSPVSVTFCIPLTLKSFPDGPILYEAGSVITIHGKCFSLHGKFRIIYQAEQNYD